MIARLLRSRDRRRAAGPSSGGRDGPGLRALRCPTATPRGGVVILHGAGVVQGEPLRLRARAARRRPRRARASTSAATARATGALDGARRSTTSPRWPRCCPPAPLGAARLRAWAATWRSSPRRRSARRRSWRSARRRADGAARAACAPGASTSAADRPALEAFLAEHDDLEAAGAALGARLLLLHAEGDERVPGRALARARTRAAPGTPPASSCPGGHHRSIQHDPELQGRRCAGSLRACAESLSAPYSRARPGHASSAAVSAPRAPPPGAQQRRPARAHRSCRARRR